jgi:hypothetical protein
MVGTLFAVPLVYTSLIVNQERAGRLWRRLRGRERSPIEPVEPPVEIRPTSRAS